MTYQSDVEIAKTLLGNLNADWDGKESVLELKAANYNWRQMEWWGFYFELLCQKNLQGEFEIPGEKITLIRRDGRRTIVKFDAKRSINWDLKSTAVTLNNHKAILNDQAAMDVSIQTHGAHGLIIAMCNVEYDDADRAFQKWHENLKGGKSKYELMREQRTNVSRRRKTRATLTEILFLAVNSQNVNLLETYHQGRNSDGTSRPPKYMLDFESSDRFIVDKIAFM
jgi:hypothetical protein